MCVFGELLFGGAINENLYHIWNNPLFFTITLNGISKSICTKSYKRKDRYLCTKRHLLVIHVYKIL